MGYNGFYAGSHSAMNDYSYIFLGKGVVIIMNVKELVLGHSVELEINVSHNSKTFVSNVALLHESMVFLEPIRHEGKLVGFPANYSVNLLYPDQERAFVWKNISVKAVTYKGSVYHAIELIGDAEIINRRAAYRVYIGEQMPVTFFSNAGLKSFDALIRDISETGFSFFSNDSFDIGRTVRLNLPFSSAEHIKLSSQIVRKQSSEERNDMLYGCRFSEKNRYLSSYLMSIQQMRQRQKMKTVY